MNRLASPCAPDFGVGDLIGDFAELAGKIVCSFPFLAPAAGRSCLPSFPKLSVGCDNCCDNSCDNCCDSSRDSCCDLYADDACGCGDEDCWPCWMPCRLEQVRAVAGPGTIVRVTFDIVNRSLAERTFLVAATGPQAALAKGDPSTVAVEPMGCGQLVALIHVPSTSFADPLNLTLWVRGCKDYVVPVCIAVVGDGSAAMVKRRVIEQIDGCHTWRDHFYVSRGCAEVKRG